MPPYICDRSSGYRSKSAPGFNVASVYERAATAAEVTVERQHVHGRQPTRLSPDHDVAPVASPAKSQRLCARLETQRKLEPFEARANDVRPWLQVHLAATGVEDEERRTGADTQGELLLLQQDAHRAGTRCGDVRVRVVVGENLAVAEAVTRVALRAPLAHTDSVTPPSTVEQEHRAAVRKPWEREGDE
jgi:hypothetical protein